MELAGSLQKFRNGYRRSFYRRKNSEALERLKVYWQSSWALGHLVALFGTVLRQLFESQTIRTDTMITMGLACFTVSNHSTPMVLRGAWAAARAGHHLLSTYKRTFEANDDYLILLDSVVVLTAIGLRHRRLRGEVRKLLARRRNPMFTPGGGNPRLPEMLSWYEQVLEKDDAARLAHRMLGAAMFL